MAGCGRRPPSGCWWPWSAGSRQSGNGSWRLLRGRSWQRLRMRRGRREPRRARCLPRTPAPRRQPRLQPLPAWGTVTGHYRRSWLRLLQRQGSAGQVGACQVAWAWPAGTAAAWCAGNPGLCCASWFGLSMQTTVSAASMKPNAMHWRLTHASWLRVVPCCATCYAMPCYATCRRAV